MEEFTDNQQINEFENPEPQRPTGLTILCVLSFINAAWQFLANFIMFASYDMMKNLSSDENYIEMLETMNIDIDEMETAMAATYSASKYYYLLTALLYIGSFFGVLYMWKQQKRGFHIYSIAQILLLIVMVLMFTSVTGASPWSSVIFTAIFILLYSIYYRKSMK